MGGGFLSGVERGRAVTRDQSSRRAIGATGSNLWILLQRFNTWAGSGGKSFVADGDFSGIFVRDSAGGRFVTATHPTSGVSARS
jgi:hypothetical protein